MAPGAPSHRGRAVPQGLGGVLRGVPLSLPRRCLRAALPVALLPRRVPRGELHKDGGKYGQTSARSCRLGTARLGAGAEPVPLLLMLSCLQIPALVPLSHGANPTVGV